MNETGGSNTQSGSYNKRKFDGQLDSTQSDQPSTFKKARFPWQIKGVSVERNIISREVTIDENDPKHLVGLLRYEEKGIVEVDLSNSASCSHFMPNVDVPNAKQAFENEEKEPSLKDQNTENVFDFKSDIWKGCKRPIQIATNDGMKIDQSIEHESDNQSSMDHEVSIIQNQREDFVNNPTVTYQQCVWQKREMGCAIVDNVFNKTLEEMGLSPDPKVNQFATDRLQILQQGIDAAINQQGLYTQSDHIVQSHAGDRVQMLGDRPHQDPKRRLSLEDMPTTSAFSKRRLSQPLCGYGIKYKHSEVAPNQDSGTTRHSEDNRINTIEDMNNNNNMESVHEVENDNRMSMNPNDVAIDTDISDFSDQNTIGATQHDNMNEQNGDSTSNHYENSCQSGNNSENLLDLAVSTAIKSQGLSL